VTRTAAIALRIPDNEAYTALVALARLGVDVAKVERSEIWRFDDDGDPATLAARIESDESLFNANKHRLTLLDGDAPRAGEVWIVRAGDAGKPRIDGVRSARRCIGWRLFDAHGAPVARAVLQAAAERLLCNPAIETAQYV
jgi:phosphoribosylformylglycinamidine (FGAM) synthase PurS component